VIAQLHHLLQLHHPTALRKGPRGYLGWWEMDRVRFLVLLVQILKNAAKDLAGIQETYNNPFNNPFNNLVNNPFNNPLIIQLIIYLISI
jgi:hypothetical protein